MTRTAAPAADLATQFDALVVDLESRVWADVVAVQTAEAEVQLALTAGPALHRLVAGMPTVGGVLRTTYDRLARGEDIDPETFAVAVAGAGATMDAARAAAILASSGLDGARAGLLAAQRAHQDKALGILDRIVRELVALARPLLEAEQVLGSTRRYAEIGETRVAIERAAVAHTTIRTVQFAVTHDALVGDTGRLLRTFGIVSDVRAHLPRVVSMADVGAAYQPEVREVNDGDAMLRFVCRADLEAWVPSYAEARRAKADLDQHVAGLRDAAENPVRADRDDSGDPVVVVHGAAGRTPVVRAR